MNRSLTVASLTLLAALAGTTAPALGAAPTSAALRNLVVAAGGTPSQVNSPRYAYLEKLDGNLQALAGGDALPATGGAALSGPAVTLAGRTLVDVYVNGDMQAAVRDLRDLGVEVQAVSRDAPQRMVEGYLPLDAATSVAALDESTAVVAAPPGGTDSGSVLSQGDAAEHGPQARALGATGAGVPVGVMSDSIAQVAGGAGLAQSQANGDLPAGVTVLNDAPGGADEGRAMAEIIYDEAPGVTNMYFDTGTTGAATKAAHIAELVSHGVKVIADDTFYLGEPFFQDGVVSQAVDAAKAAGVAYIASAGNRARQSWEGTFTPGTGGNNDFGGGEIQQSIITVPAGARLTGELQWNEPWGHATTNLDANLFVNGTLFGPGSGQSDNIASGIPAEFFGVQAGSSSIQVALQINRFAGTGTPQMKYILANNFGPFSIVGHNTDSNTIDPDAAAAKGSLAVAAVCWSTLLSNCNGFGPAGLTTPESYSSRGPLVRTRDASGNLLATPETRQKPNLAGADAVATSVPGFAPFSGTSAAAPSVAGVAALALSAKPTLSVDQLYGLLTDPANALDCTSAAGSPDADCGSGFIQADRVVAAALAPAATTPAPVAPIASTTPIAPVSPTPGTPVASKCKVPKLAGKSLKAAKKALKRAHCKLGKTDPTHPAPQAVVESSSPGKGAVRPAGAKVSVTLGTNKK
jgi:hypothetical protein